MEKDFRSLKVQIKEISRKSEENSITGILKRFNKSDQHNYYHITSKHLIFSYPFLLLLRMNNFIVRTMGEEKRDIFRKIKDL